MTSRDKLPRKTIASKKSKDAAKPSLRMKTLEISEDEDYARRATPFLSSINYGILKSSISQATRSKARRSHR
jgi:hypothetical protein